MDVVVDSLELRALSKGQNWRAEPWLFYNFSHQLHAYYLGIYWSGWIVLIKNEILITTEMVWPASSDK